MNLTKVLPKNVVPLWAAGFISNIGDSLHQVALMWLVLELTGSSTATGLVGMAQYLPSVIVGLFAGALVDKWDKKKAMIVSDATRIILVAMIPTLYLMNQMNGVILGVLAFCIAIFTTVFMPARDSILPQLAEPGELTKLNSIMQVSFGTAWFIGPMLAAALLPVIKLTGLFYADSITFLLSLVFLLKLNPRKDESYKPKASAFKLVKEGLNYAKSNGLVSGILLVTAVDNFFIMGPAIVGAPLFVKYHLGLGAGSFAAVEGAFALGMIAGGLLAHRLASKFPRGKILLWAIIFDGITFVPFLFADSLTLTLIIWFVHSIGIPFILVPRSSLVQTQVPENFQGRIFSMINLTVVGLSAISCALTGIIAEYISTPILYAIIGISATIVGGLGWLFKDLREAT